jgi:Pentapeptide repeats (8 copies)
LWFRSQVDSPSVKSMTRFHEQDLTGAHFERVSLRDAHLNAVDLTGAQIRGCWFNGSRMRGVDLVDVEIRGELQNVVVNGVDIAPLVEAELNLRMPERAKMRPEDSDGFREAWAILERLCNSYRARLAPDGELPRQGMSPHRPQRGVAAPALCRA